MNADVFRRVPQRALGTAAIGPVLMLLSLSSCFTYWLNAAGGPRVAVRGMPLDDGWIHLVYARSLAESLRPFYNDGVLESGMTSPLWVVLNALAWWPARTLTANPTAAAKLLSVAFAGASAVVLFRLARRRGVAPPISLVPSFLLCVDSEWTFAAASGMEPTLGAFMALWAADAVDRGAWDVAGRTCALAIAVRPELVILAPAVALTAWARPLTPAERRAALIRIALPVLAVITLWMSYNLFVTGRPLPNSFYVKAQTSDLWRPSNAVNLGLVVGRTAWFSSPVGLMAFLAGLVFMTFSVRRNVVPLVFPALFLATLSVTHTFVQTTSFYWTRYAHPVLPFLVLPIGVLGGILASKFPSKAFQGVLALALLIGCGYPVVDRFPSNARLFSRNCRDIEMGTVAAGRWIAVNTRPGDRIAVMDAGATRYFGDRQILDLVGLNSHEMIGTGSWWDAVLAARPDFLVLIPPLVPDLINGLGLEPVLVLHNPDLSVCDCPAQSTLVIFRAPWRPAGRPAAPHSRPY